MPGPTKRPLRDVNAMLGTFDEASVGILSNPNSEARRNAYETAVTDLRNLVAEISATVELGNNLVLSHLGLVPKAHSPAEAARQRKARQKLPTSLRTMVARDQARKDKSN